MGKYPNRLFIDVKDFLLNEINRVLIALIIIGSVLIYMLYDIKKDILQLNNDLIKAIYKAEKKVDYRYFNTVKSLEEIYNIEINTKDGRIICHRVNNQ